MSSLGSYTFRKYTQANWILVDQALVSGANFVTTVLLARYMSIEEFGWFSFFWIELMFIRGLQSALIVAPMLSIGPKIPTKDTCAYFTGLFIQQIVIAIAACALTALGTQGAAWIFGDSIGYEVVFPLATLVLMDQLQDFFRRSFIAQRREKLAFINDCTNYLGRLLGLATVLQLWESSLLPYVLWSMAIASGVSATHGLCSMGSMEWSRHLFKEVTARHWMFSKWLVASALFEVIVANVYSIVAGAVLGVTALGVIRASANVLGPAQVLQQALNNLLPVQASQRYARDGKDALKTYLLRSIVMGAGTTVVFATIACATPEFWLTLLYGEKYLGYEYMVYWQAIIYIVASVLVSLRAGFRALECTRPLFLSVCVQDVFAIVSAYPLALWFHLPGTMFGHLWSQLIPLFILSMMLSNQLRSSGQGKTNCLRVERTTYTSRGLK